MNRRVRTSPRRAAGPRRNLSRRARTARIARVVKAASLLAGAALVAAVSLFFVFVHDLFIQSDYFSAREVLVEGAARSSAREIQALTGIRPGVNVLAVNLSAARRALLSHPWVAEAQVHRELPARLRITVREHIPVAIVDVGQRFLLNAGGEVFKLWEASDPAGLPVVSGLSAADLRAADRSAAAGRPGPFLLGPAPPPDPLRPRAVEAVLQVLALGREPDAALPARQIRAIRVDRELGLTVTAFPEGAAVRLGYDDYAVKYRLLADLMAFFKAHPPEVDFDRIDLTDVHRVIVNPVKSDPARVGGG